MTVTAIVTSLVLIAAVVAWLRARRANRTYEPMEPLFDERAVESIGHQSGPRVEIWISLDAHGSRHRDAIVTAIDEAELGDVAEIGSPTDILLETDDVARAQREIRSMLDAAGLRATISVTRAADGGVRTH